jgi:hypothetical protein
VSSEHHVNVLTTEAVGGLAEVGTEECGCIRVLSMLAKFTRTQWR